MRSKFHAAATLLALLLASSLAAAQTADRAAAPLPRRPLPYAALHPKHPAAKAVPHAAGASHVPAPTPKPADIPPVTPPPVAAPVLVAPMPPRAPASPVASTPAAPVPMVSGARLAPGDPLPAAELEAFADGVIRDAMARDHIAGVTVSVVQNGQVVLKKGYGFASLGPTRAVDPDRTLFRLGAISKTFTWIAVMKEVEAGRILLDRPINLYLPEKLQVRDQGYDAPVRVVNLMDHSAGFEDRTLGHLFERDYDRVRPLEVYLRQERPRRVHPPGAVASYSNYGVALAGEAVTYTAGKSFERLAEDEIFAPLGLRHTSFREPHPQREGLPPAMPAALARDLSDGFRWTPAGFQARPFEYGGQIAPAGAASSTAADMATYMTVLLGNGQANGVTLYSPKTAEAFRTPLRTTPKGINGWAHGFEMFDLPGGYQGYGHRAATLSFMSSLITVPALNLGIFISANTETGGALAQRFPEELVRRFYARPVVFPRPASPDLAADAGAFEGSYVSTHRAYRGLEGFVDQLTGAMRVSVTADGHLVTATAGGSRLWSPEGTPQDGRFIDAAGDGRLAFQMADGQAVAYQTADGAGLMERTPLWRRPLALALLAALTAAAALATPIGLLFRNRREFRENAMQNRASLIQNTQAALWLAALALFGLWMSKSGDAAEVMYRWPGALLVTASACALVAAALTALTLIAVPAIWRGGRRVDSWTALRKMGFTLTALIYAAFSVVLGLWGALSPWSG